MYGTLHEAQDKQIKNQTQYIAEICINQLQMASTTATTECTITNGAGAGQNLVLTFSNYETAAGTIENPHTTTFTQTMPVIYLNGALVYKVGRCLRWIIFWTSCNEISCSQSPHPILPLA